MPSRERRFCNPDTSVSVWLSSPKPRFTFCFRFGALRFDHLRTASHAAVRRLCHAGRGDTVRAYVGVTSEVIPYHVTVEPSLRELRSGSAVAHHHNTIALLSLA